MASTEAHFIDEGPHAGAEAYRRSAVDTAAYLRRLLAGEQMSDAETARPTAPKQTGRTR